jgi:hypothetical protein
VKSNRIFAFDWLHVPWLHVVLDYEYLGSKTIMTSQRPSILSLGRRCCASMYYSGTLHSFLRPAVLSYMRQIIERMPAPSFDWHAVPGRFAVIVQVPGGWPGCCGCLSFSTIVVDGQEDRGWGGSPIFAIREYGLAPNKTTRIRLRLTSFVPIGQWWYV